MALSNAVMNALLDLVLRKTAYAGPPALYLSLHSADPGVTGANELPAAEGYARVLVRSTDGTTNVMSAAAAKASSNGIDLVFPEAGGDGWPPATHVGLWDAAAGGNFVAGAALAAAKTAAVGVAIRIKAGDLDVVGT